MKELKLENKTSDGVLHTRNLILHMICAIYFCAFSSFYFQCEGLFGINGIQPTNIQIKWKNNPNLFSSLSFLRLNVDSIMDLIALVGSIISLIGLLSKKFCTMPLFAMLWLAYLSLVQIMQSFINQSDNLLLETGFICIMLAPFSNENKSRISDKVWLVMLKWLLFRFIFLSDAVKFYSHCPLWWSFSGLIYYLETMPLPTYIAWYCHNLSKNFLISSTLYTHFVNIVCPVFFFFPCRNVRIFLFYANLYLQLCIISCGYCGFLNFLKIALLFSLLDDKYFQSKNFKSFILNIFSTIIGFSLIIYICSKFDVDKLKFRDENLNILRYIIRLSPLAPLAALMYTFFSNLYSHPTIVYSKNVRQKFLNMNSLLAFTLFAITILVVSIVPHYNIDETLNITQTKLGKLYKVASKTYVINEYGRQLRRLRMERFEIQLQVQDSDEKWTDIQFLYKPGGEYQSFFLAGPYLSRLDMKFYDAANASYKEHPWILSLTNRILQNEKSVLRLLKINNTYNKPPKYVRSIKNKMKFTNFSESKQIWEKSFIEEYIPPYSLYNSSLKIQLKKYGFEHEQKINDRKNYILSQILDFIRYWSNFVDPAIFINTTLVSSLIKLIII